MALTKTLLTNIRGPRGFTGLQGQQGIPGLENVPTDPGIAALVAVVSQTQTALDARYGRKNALPYNVKSYGAVGDGAANDTAAIQAAIDAAFAAGGGTVYLPDGTYAVSASVLGEAYDNEGVPVSSATCAIVLRKGVSLTGSGSSRCKLTTADRTLIVVAMVAPERNVVSGFEIAGAWSVGLSGAGHGIFVLGTAGGADIACKGVTWRDLRISGVGSYGIGLQAGSPTGCRIESVRVENIGADGLDLKARSDVITEPSGNSASGIYVKNHGQRVTGSAGVDVRGLWNLSNITVTDFAGNNNALTYIGIRFRTKPTITDAYNKAGARSTLDGFYIRATPAAPIGLSGVESGSDDVHISNGVIENVFEGVLLTGNAVGSARGNTVHGVTVIGSTAYGFRTVVGVARTVFSSCTSVSSVTAGFRNEGDHTTFVGCQSISETLAISTASAAAPTEIVNASRFGAEYGLSVTTSTAGRVQLTARGDSADIDFVLIPKGAGITRWGTGVASGDAAVVGYFTHKTADGVTRKIPYIA